jgi:hypothetical protein
MCVNITLTSSEWIINLNAEKDGGPPDAVERRYGAIAQVIHDPAHSEEIGAPTRRGLLHTSNPHRSDSTALELL